MHGMWNLFGVSYHPCIYFYKVSQKKTEFCQIEHLQILLVFGEKYLMKFVANPVVSCFESAISMLLLGALQIQPWGHTGSGKGH